MNVTEILAGRDIAYKACRPRFTKEQLQRECDFRVAEIILKQMLDKGVVNNAEYTIFTNECRNIFSPALAALM